MELNEINTESKEGKMLMAALAILTTSEGINYQGKKIDGTKMTPVKMLDKVDELASVMYS